MSQSNTSEALHDQEKRRSVIGASARQIGTFAAKAAVATSAAVMPFSVAACEGPRNDVPSVTRTIEVEEGDTLSGITQEVCSPNTHADLVTDIANVALANNLPSDQISAGETLVIPAGICEN